MKEYTAFAKVYDVFMTNIPYDKWSELIDAYLQKNSVGNRLLELGCGTGNFTFLMAEKGYNIMGIDCSKEMIDAAVKKNKKMTAKSIFEVQDMRVLEIEDKFDCVLSVCDSMNYMLDEFDLSSVFQGTAGVLPSNGLFIFDMKTEVFYESLGESTFSDETENGDYVWNNFYDKKNRNNQYELNLYIRKKNNLYIKHTEEHLQHVFTPQEIQKCAAENGFEIKEVLGMDLCSPADYNAERVYYILKKK